MKQNNSFIRVLFGDYSNRTKNRRIKIDLDIQNCIHLSKKHGIDFITYVFGKNNYEQLKQYDLNLVLIHDEPYKFDLKRLYQHKIFSMQEAMKTYDEIVYLDLDCAPIKPIPYNFWDIINPDGEGDPFQACLFKYKGRRCMWRKYREDQSYVSNGGFVYIGDKTLPNKFNELWETNNFLKNQENDEIVYSCYLDQIDSGFNVNYYMENHQPDCCIIGGGPAKPEHLFRHWGGWRDWKKLGEL